MSERLMTMPCEGGSSPCYKKPPLRRWKAMGRPPTSARVDRIAGARPNKTPLSSESAAVTPRTHQFNSARILKFSWPLDSSSVKARTPQTANSTPSTPPREASRTLSVKTCRRLGAVRRRGSNAPPSRACGWSLSRAADWRCSRTRALASGSRSRGSAARH